MSIVFKPSGFVFGSGYLPDVTLPPGLEWVVDDDDFLMIAETKTVHLYYYELSHDFHGMRKLLATKNGDQILGDWEPIIKRLPESALPSIDEVRALFTKEKP